MTTNAQRTDDWTTTELARFSSEADLVRWQLLADLVRAGFLPSTAEEIVHQVEAADVDMERAEVVVHGGNVTVRDAA